MVILTNKIKENNSILNLMKNLICINNRKLNIRKFTLTLLIYNRKTKLTNQKSNKLNVQIRKII